MALIRPLRLPPSLLLSAMMRPKLKGLIYTHCGQNSTLFGLGGGGLQLPISLEKSQNFWPLLMRENRTVITVP